MGRRLYPPGLNSRADRDRYVVGRASQMADSGNYIGWAWIEDVLVRSGYTRAHFLLSGWQIRLELDQRCRKSHPSLASSPVANDP